MRTDIFHVFSPLNSQLNVKFFFGTLVIWYQNKGVRSRMIYIR